MNIRASLAIALPSFFLLLGGCIIIDGNTNGAGGGGIGGKEPSTSTTSSTGSSVGGAGGQGGQGGSAGAGVGGGGPMCAGPDDGILDVLACDKLNTKGVLCNGVDALANRTCKLGYDIFQGGAFDVLVKCLQGIEGDMANACDNTQVDKCIAVMYEASCPSPVAAKACDDLSTITCAGDTFDTQGCLLATYPFQPKALQELGNCIADPMSDPVCQKAYDDCLAQILTF